MQPIERVGESTSPWGYGWATGTTLELRRDQADHQVLVQQGDVLFASIAVKANVAITPPAGFVSINRIVTSGNELALECFYKVCGASEPQGYSFTLSGSAWSVGMLSAVRYADPSKIIAGAAGQGHASSVNNPAPAIVTAINHVFFIRVYGFTYFETGWDKYTMPNCDAWGGFTYGYQPGSAVVLANVWNYDQAYAGNSGTPQVIATTANINAAQTIAFKPMIPGNHMVM